MEPVFQRLGDVTIQRLEKPKEKPPPPPEQTKTENPPAEKDTEETEAVSAKRELEILPSSSKKFKFDTANISIVNKSTENLEFLSDSELSKRFKFEAGDVSITNRANESIDDFLSENEMSEYETESEFDSEEEPPRSEASKDDKEPPENDNFLDDLVRDSLENPPPETAETNTSNTEDYDYDIKEKLKEMGEISFETVKKGEKPKKPETASENEVVVTSAKKPGDEDGLGERKGGMLRRNIREVMDETKLDESTLAAQRQEAERLKRVNEQHRFLREVQRQLAQERMQNKVISLLQGSAAGKPGMYEF